MTASLAQAHRDALPAGTILNGYQILGVLGRGGFGITYRASDLLDQAFAIKEFFPRQFAMREGLDVVVTSDSDSDIFVDCRKRFLTEARLLASLGRGGGTPGIVRVATFFEANNTAYSVMELLSGETLDDLLKGGRTPMPADELLSLLRGILMPLARVHAAGFLHRDIKPANILIRPDGQPVLIDFGSARDIGPSAATTYTQVYSGHYAPLEQMIQGAAQGPFSDIFSVGCAAYRAIGGNLVDARARQQAVLGHAPDPLISAVQVGHGNYPYPLLVAIDRALALRATDRPQSVAEMLEMMERSSAQEDIPTRRVRPPTEPMRPAYRAATRDTHRWDWRVHAAQLGRAASGPQWLSRTTVARIAALLALVIVGLGSLYLYQHGRSGDQLAALHVVLARDENGVAARFPEATDSTMLVRVLPRLAALRVTTLDLRNSRIATLPPLQPLSALQSLDLSGSDVAIVESLDGLSSLRELNLAHSKIATLPPLHDLTALRKLDLSYTPITVLPPLDALTALEDLDLSHTDIAAVPALDGLAELRRLDLTGSRVASLPQAGWMRHVQVIPPSLVAAAEPAPEQRMAAMAPPLVQPAPPPEAEPVPPPVSSPASKVTRPPVKPPPAPTASQARPPPKPPTPAPQEAPGSASATAAASAAIPARPTGPVTNGEPSRSGYEYFQQGFAASEMRNYAEAKALYLRGAEKGDEHCMYWLGYMYASGLGVSPDYPEAQSWYKRAADHGYALAFYNIALLHIGGGPGMPRDCNNARGWFERAAAHGISVAQAWLAANPSCQ